MVLVDTSVWISHLREGNRGLADLLEENSVTCHPFIIGELACGNLANRAEILGLLAALPPTERATDAEVLTFIEKQGLSGKGLGLIDVHLLASARLSGVKLWSRDRRLAQAAEEVGCGYDIL